MRQSIVQRLGAHEPRALKRGELDDAVLREHDGRRPHGAVHNAEAVHVFQRQGQVFNHSLFSLLVSL